MRKLAIYQNKILAGTLIEESRNSYIFIYEEKYFLDKNMPAISLTLPKNKREHRNDTIFPFFANNVAEGENLSIQIKAFKIDENDVFSLLERTAVYDTIGAVTVKKLEK